MLGPLAALLGASSAHRTVHPTPDLGRSHKLTLLRHWG